MISFQNSEQIVHIYFFNRFSLNSIEQISIQGVHRDADKSKRLFREEKIIRY